MSREANGLFLTLRSLVFILTLAAGVVGATFAAAGWVGTRVEASERRAAQRYATQVDLRAMEGRIMERLARIEGKLERRP